MACRLLFITLVSLAGVFGQVPYDDNDTQILILGAGPGGLVPASILMANNFTDFIVLEGGSQAWGILKEVFIDGVRFETQPWFYDESKGAVDAHNLTYHENDYYSYVVRNDLAMDVTSEFDELFEDFETAHNATNYIAEDSIDGKRLDVSRKVALAMSGWVSSESLENAIEWYEIDFEYGRTSRDVSQVGSYLQDYGYVPTYYVTDRGPVGGILQPIIDSLDEDHLRLNQNVTNVDQSGDRVVVTTQDGSQYTADYVLVTFGIGVLQRGSVTFTPDLPPWKTEQICRFQRGILDPIFLKFPSKFWGDEEWILHAGKKGYYPAFLNAEAEGLYPPGTNVLIGWVTGEAEAIRIEGLSDDEVQAEVLDVLRGMYGSGNVPDPEFFYIERYGTNPLHYGSHSNAPIPANVPADSIRRLQAHVGRVFFANDAATAPELIGKLGGTVASSEQATIKILGCIAGEDCSGYEPDETDGSLFGECVEECLRYPKNPEKARKERNEEP